MLSLGIIFYSSFEMVLLHRTQPFITFFSHDINLFIVFIIFKVSFTAASQKMVFLILITGFRFCLNILLPSIFLNRKNKIQTNFF